MFNPKMPSMFTRIGVKFEHKAKSKYMKKILGAFFLCAVLCCGCSDSEIHVDKVRAAFQGLPPEQMAQVDESLKNITASNYPAALKPLRSIALTAKLDKKQVNVLNDTMKKILIKMNAKP